ncbi:MAG: AarF/ABC1/UbiB kinase family protein [Deltaproteobacteria bacterium]|nr:AarF/ABC1/UbiB kinase family protein [Deltaproteobacteria bacterium]
MGSGPGATAFSRLREIAAVMARHGFAPTMRTMPLVRAFASEDDVARRARPAAERFAAMLEELGPTFVKLGQILSTRADLLPPDFVAALSRLQDQVPPFPLDDVRRTLAEAWGLPPAQVFGDRFASFDETPLASASMAQVHAAVLKDGRAVVVKVQRPGIAASVRKDSEILMLVAQLLERVVQEASTYHAVDLITEFKTALHGELDFRREQKSLEAFAKKNAGRPGVHVPYSVPELSGGTVLVMERLHGRRITELAGQPDRAARVVERLVEVAFEHVFVDGLFHGDPHPGNLLIDDEDRVAFIDFGVVGTVPRETQDRLLTLLLALSLRDVDTLARIVVRLGDVDSRVDLVPFRAALQALLDRYFGLSLGEVATGAVFADLVDLSTRFGIRLPREMAILSKASVSIDGVVRALHPRFDPSAMIARRAEELLRQRLDPREWKSGGLRTALQLGLVVQELPQQLGQALLDLERGHVQVTVKSEALESLNATLRGMSMSISGGILAGTLVLAGFFTLDRAGLTQKFAPLIAGGAFALASGCFGVAFGWYLSGGRLPKLTLARLIAGRARRVEQRTTPTEAP